jgi:hypothetical protein
MKYLYISLLLLFLCLGCVKSTEYSGRILNAADNSPVEGARCFMNIGGKYQNNETRGDTDVMYSDSLGNYALKVKFERADYKFIRIEKTGFVTKNIGIEYGKCREQDIVIYPYDAYLSVTFENKSSSATKDFYYIFGCELFGTGKECGPEGCGPFSTSPLSKRTQVKKVPGGFETNIVWDTKKLDASSSINQLNIFCPRNDTTYVTIPF